MTRSRSYRYLRCSPLSHLRRAYESQTCCVWTCVLLCSQDRNAQHANGGAEASRLTAQARRKLATLGTTVENLADKLEGLDSV